MEEYEYKFSQDNPVLTYSAVRGITEKIKKLKETEDQIAFAKLSLYLKEKCLNGDDCVATTASAGLLSLCTDGILNFDEVLKDFVASIQHSKNSTGILNFLIRGLEFTSVTYSLNYMHPLIIFLNKYPDAWPNLLISFKQKVLEQDKSEVINKLQLKPFLLYVLYDYDKRINQHLQLALLDLFKHNLDEIFYKKIILFSPNHLQRSFKYAATLLDVDETAPANLTKCIRQMLIHNIAPHEAIYLLKQYILRSPKYTSLVLSLLSDCLYHVPYIYLSDILDICEVLLDLTTNSEDINIIRASLIVWRLQFATLDSNSVNITQRIDKLITTENTKTISPFTLTNSFDIDFYLNQTNLNFLLLKELPSETILKLFNRLLQHFTESNEHLEETLSVLLMCCDHYRDQTSKLLPILLFKLSSNTDPQQNLILIRALPKLAVLKENLPVVVTTLKAIGQAGGVMQTLALSVFYELYEIDNRCFPYLQEFLIKENVEDFQQDGIAKAYILKELCRKNLGLEVIGSDLTIYLSNILNKKTLKSMALSLAFEGLQHLCRNDIIDVGSAWYNLEPRFKDETSPTVLNSLCGLMGEVPFLRVQGPKYDQLVKDVVEKLWGFVIGGDEVVLGGAFKALGEFDLEQITPDLPKEFLGDNLVTADGSVSGICWIQMLNNVKASGLESASNMLISQISTELKCFRKGVYHVMEGRDEPIAMNVSKYSIVGTIATYLRKNVERWEVTQPEIYLECLRILGYQYSRPLPIMDWSFLQEILQNPRAQKHCIALLSRQVALSGTARKLMENYLLALPRKKNFAVECFYVYENLQSLCSSIQPQILRPFIEKSVADCVREGKKEGLKIICECIKQVLQNRNLLEAYKFDISEILVGTVENMDYESEMFDLMLDCIAVLPMKFLDDLSCPRQYDTLSERTLDRCLKIRCAAALLTTENPFVFLDNFIDCHLLKTRYQYFRIVYGRCKRIFIKYRKSKYLGPWLMELMAKIQLDLADNKNIDNVAFIMSTYIIGICVASGFHIFQTNALDIFQFMETFPYGLNSIIQTETLKLYTTQILDWLYDVSTNHTYKKSQQSGQFINTFKHSLLTLRNLDSFNEYCKWLKYIDITL